MNLGPIAAPEPAPAPAGGPDAGVGSAAGGGSDAGGSTPDPAFQAMLTSRLGSMGYRVTSASAMVDGMCGAIERSASVSRDTSMPISLTVTDYTRDTRPNGHALIALSPTRVVLMDPGDDATVPPAQGQALVGLGASSGVALQRAIVRLGWTVDTAPDESDDPITGAREINAVAQQGDHTVTVTVREFRAIPRGGEEPRAYRVRGSQLYVATDGDNRAELDRVLDAISR